jgi:uncharacterized protein YbaP (TraB family)
MNVKLSRKIIFASGLQLLLCLLVSLAVAGNNFERGLLWQIKKPGSPPSYLFGTMHIEDPEVVTLAAPVREAFDKADSLTLEVVLDPQSLLAMATAFMLTDGSTLESHIGSQLYQRSVKAMAAHGMPEMMVARMKPWAVAVTLMTPPPETGVVLDLMLYQEATAQGKPVTGLETPMEQMSLFDSFSGRDQIALLKDTLDNMDEIPRMFADLKAAYLDRDLARLVKVSDDSMRDNNQRLVEDFNRKLITERNHRMVQRMQPLLKEGQQFIAVGALHLPGEEGLLQLLNDQGYSVTAVY